MAMNIGLAQVILPPCGGEDRSKDYAPTAARAVFCESPAAKGPWKA